MVRLPLPRSRRWLVVVVGLVVLAVAGVVAVIVPGDSTPQADPCAGSFDANHSFGDGVDERDSVGMTDPGPDHVNHVLVDVLERKPLTTVRVPNSSRPFEFDGQLPSCDVVARTLRFDALYMATHDDPAGGRIAGEVIDGLAAICRDLAPDVRRRVLSVLGDPLARVLVPSIFDGDINAKVAAPSVNRQLGNTQDVVQALRCLGEDQAAFNRMMLAESLYAQLHMQSLAKSATPGTFGSTVLPVANSFVQVYGALVAGLGGSGGSTYSRLFDPYRDADFLMDVGDPSPLPSTATFGAVELSADRYRVVALMDAVLDGGPDQVLLIPGDINDVTQDYRDSANDLVGAAAADVPGFSPDNDWFNGQVATALSGADAAFRSGYGQPLGSAHVSPGT